jgi:hypothetical protein
MTDAQIYGFVEKRYSALSPRLGYGRRVRSRPLKQLLLLVATALGVGACGGGAHRGCTLTDCVGGATVLLPGLNVPDGEALAVRVCADGRCQDGQAQPASNSDLQADVAVPLEGGLVELVITVRDERGTLVARGRGAATVHVSYPNGPDCPPVCRSVRVRVTDGQLVTA